MAQKKIINPVTRKAYSIRQRDSKYGKKGQIKGLYKVKNRKNISSYINKNIGDVLRMLSDK